MSFNLSSTSFNPFGGAEQLDTQRDTDLSYNRNVPLPKAVGGIPAGTTFNGDIFDVLDMLFYPPVESSVTLTSNAPNINKQFGVTTLNSISLIADIKKGTGTPVKIEFYGGNKKLTTMNYENGKETYRYTLSSSITQTTTYYVKVYDDKGKVTTSSYTIYFYLPTYSMTYEGEIENLTMSFIEANGNKMIEAKTDKTISYSGDLARYLYCYPASYGELATITDSNGFLYNNAFVKLNMTCVSGTQRIPMYCYVTKNVCTLTNFKYKYKF